MAERTFYDTVLVPGNALPSQIWWPTLHQIIIEAFRVKDYSVFPPTWTRLNADPAKGAEGLAQELGMNGSLVVAFSEDGHPVACGGVLPFRGEDWIGPAGENRGLNHTIEKFTMPAVDCSPSESFKDWEVCCFCINPSARGQGLSQQLLDAMITLIKTKGAERLLAHYAVDETGDFWTKMGFDVVPNADSTLPKGFQVDPEKEGLKAEVHFKMAARAL